MSIFLLAYATAQLPAGFAVGRFGVRGLFSIAMIGTSVATGLVGTATSLLALKIYRFALGNEPISFRSWNIWGCALGYSFQLGISNVLLDWIPTYLISVKHFSVAGMGVVAAAPWVGAVFGNVLGGYVSDRFLGRRRKPGMMLSALATAIMMAALINSPANPVAYGCLLLLTGALLSFGFSAYMVYPMSIASKQAFPVASAIVNMGGQLGGLLHRFSRESCLTRMDGTTFSASWRSVLS
ncbi:MFS transporter [Pandoraea terrae]|uniref:MFS transporter n=1 Tax=Pandoraea terrae TaxID=1537710 RepID=UPI001CD324A6|nr:MFS transporter [Pandoraea terrae]